MMYVLSCKCPNITLPDEEESSVYAEGESSVYAEYTFPTSSVPTAQQEDEVCDADQFLIV